MWSGLVVNLQGDIAGFDHFNLTGVNLNTVYRSEKTTNGMMNFVTMATAFTVILLLHAQLARLEPAVLGTVVLSAPVIAIPCVMHVLVSVAADIPRLWVVDAPVWPVRQEPSSRRRELEHAQRVLREAVVPGSGVSSAPHTMISRVRHAVCSVVQGILWM